MLVTTLQRKLKTCLAQARWRQLWPVRARAGNHILLQDQACINFASNNYLGLADDRQVKAAFCDAVQTYGVGSGSASSICGYFAPQQALEAAFCEFLNCDSALFFNSGYHANLGVLTTLLDRSSTVLADREAHASLLDGIQLSRAKHYRYRHQDRDQIQTLIQQKQPHLLVTESVFGMDGRITSVADLVTLANTQHTAVLVDEAHSLGVLGPQGRGVCAAAGINANDLAALVAPLGKAFAGSGAIVAGRKTVIDSLLQFARSYRYSTALPPAVCASLLVALTLTKREQWRRDELIRLIDLFITEAQQRGLVLASYDRTPIKSIVIGDDARVVAIQQMLLAQGFLVSAIRPPTVAAGTARLRISLNCLHQPAEVLALLECLEQALC